MAGSSTTDSGFLPRGLAATDAKELLARNTAIPRPYQSEIGEMYSSITILKVFCYGTENLSEGTLAYIRKKGLRARAFADSGHCPMTDQAREFYSFLYQFSRDPSV